MRKILSLMALAAFGLSSEADAQSIAAARGQAIGAVVTVTGIVTNGPELGPIRYMQDASAAIAAYSPSMMNNIAQGDSIEVTGTLKNYNGLLEIDPVTTVTVLGRNKQMPTPITVTAANATSVFVEQNEGKLVKITGNTTIKTTGGAAVTTFAGNTTYRLNGVSGLDVRTNSASTGATGIVGKPAPTGNFDLTGIMSQFSSTGTGGYQILPRLYNDFDLGATPNVIQSPFASNITTTGFTVNFKTQNAGTTIVNYGTSPTALIQTLNHSGNVTNHSIMLGNLSPATVYYVQATSVNSVGVSVSSIVPMITASNSTGAMKVYFNRPVNNAYGPASNAAIATPNALDDSLVAYINRASETVDFTMYGFNNLNLTNVTNALNNAHTRGVIVRMVIQAGNNNIAPAGVSGLNPAIKYVMRPDARGIMHNKFVVIDANSTNPNKPFVWTGSTNYTLGQINTDPNSVIVIQDQSLAKVYRMEFEEMFAGGTVNGGVFGPAKTDNTPHHFNIGGTPVELYFSPSDNVNSRLIETIGTADHDIQIATMLMTRSDIAQAIRNQIQSHPGMENISTMLMDDSTGATGPYMTVKNVLNNRAQLWKSGTIFHHKYLLVDVGMPSSDPIAWVSSHNWSNAANNDNDENTLVIHNHNIANQYYQEFAARVAEKNIAGYTAVNFFVLGVNEDLNAAVKFVKVYPNPTSGAFNVSLTDNSLKAVNLTLTDVTGKVVYRSNASVVNNEISVKTQNLPKGLYNLQVKSAKGTQISKVAIF